MSYQKRYDIEDWLVSAIFDAQAMSPGQRKRAGVTSRVIQRNPWMIPFLGILRYIPEHLKIEPREVVRAIDRVGIYKIHFFDSETNLLKERGKEGEMMIVRDEIDEWPKIRK